MHRHRFEIYTLVSENHGNVDLVLGIKNIFEFIYKISGLAIVKMLNGGTHSTLLIKLKFIQNKVILPIRVLAL